MGHFDGADRLWDEFVPTLEVDLKARRTDLGHSNRQRSCRFKPAMAEVRGFTNEHDVCEVGDVVTGSVKIRKVTEDLTWMVVARAGVDDHCGSCRRQRSERSKARCAYDNGVEPVSQIRTHVAERLAIPNDPWDLDPLGTEDRCTEFKGGAIAKPFAIPPHRQAVPGEREKIAPSCESSLEVDCKFDGNE